MTLTLWVRDQGKGTKRYKLGVKLRSHIHTPGTVGECEGMSPHTPSGLPLWELESRWTFESS
jgi:hypothetical protein